MDRTFQLLKSILPLTLLAVFLAACILAASPEVPAAKIVTPVTEITTAVAEIATTVAEIATTEPSCTQPSEPTRTPLPSPTLEPPTPSPVPMDSSLSASVSALPVVKPAEPITAENAAQVRELAHWELPTLRSVQFIPGLDKVALSLEDRVVLYDPTSAAGTEQLPLPPSDLPDMQQGPYFTPDGSLVALLRGDCPNESMRCHIEVLPRTGGSPLWRWRPILSPRLALRPITAIRSSAGRRAWRSTAWSMGNRSLSCPSRSISTASGSHPTGRGWPGLSI